jgi:hypothetical protein
VLVVLNGCESWALSMRETHRLKVFDYRVLKKILELNKDEATGEWRRLHDRELYNLYSSPNVNLTIKARKMR